MNRKDILEEAVSQFLADFPGIEDDEHLSYDKGVLDNVRFLLDVESSRLRGTADFSSKEKEEIDRLGCYGKEDLEPTPFTGYAMHDLSASMQRLRELLILVSIEAKKLRNEILGPKRSSRP